MSKYLRDRVEIEKELALIEKVKGHVDRHPSGACSTEWGANRRRTQGVIDALRWVLDDDPGEPSHALKQLVTSHLGCIRSVVGTLGRREAGRRA